MNAFLKFFRSWGFSVLFVVSTCGLGTQIVPTTLTYGPESHFAIRSGDVLNLTVTSGSTYTVQQTEKETAPAGCVWTAGSTPAYRTLSCGGVQVLLMFDSGWQGCETVAFSKNVTRGSLVTTNPRPVCTGLTTAQDWNKD